MIKHNVSKIDKPNTEEQKQVFKDYKTNMTGQLLMGLMLLLTTATSCYLAAELTNDVSNSNIPAALIDMALMLGNGFWAYKEIEEMRKYNTTAGKKLNLYNYLKHHEKEQPNNNVQHEM